MEGVTSKRQDEKGGNSQCLQYQPGEGYFQALTTAQHFFDTTAHCFATTQQDVNAVAGIGTSPKPCGRCFLVTSSRYAFGAIAEWQCRQGVTQQGMIGVRPLKETARLRMRRAHSKLSMQAGLLRSLVKRGAAKASSSPPRILALL